MTHDCKLAVRYEFEVRRTCVTYRRPAWCSRTIGHSVGSLFGSFDHTDRQGLSNTCLESVLEKLPATAHCDQVMNGHAAAVDASCKYCVTCAG